MRRRLLKAALERERIAKGSRSSLGVAWGRASQSEIGPKGAGPRLPYPIPLREFLAGVLAGQMAGTVAVIPPSSTTMMRSSWRIGRVLTGPRPTYALYNAASLSEICNVTARRREALVASKASPSNASFSLGSAGAFPTVPAVNRRKREGTAECG